ncbi:MAG: hypothetical protein J6D87_05020 [Clostridia bacterium]|nr:hypothetical protein [Clostridia bacterium]
MKVRFKMLAVAMAVLTLLLCMAVPIQAAVVKPDVEPNWQNTAAITLALSFLDDGYGYAEANVIGEPGVNKIVVDIYVYRQVGDSWVLVGEEHDTYYGISTLVSCRFNAFNRAYYRADYFFTVTRNNVDETISKTKYRTCSQ